MQNNTSDRQIRSFALFLIFLFASFPCFALPVEPVATTMSAPAASYADPSEMMVRIEELSRRVDELSRLVEILMGQNALKPAAAVEAAALINRPARIQTGTDSKEPRSKDDAQKGTELPLLHFSGDFRLRLDGIFRPSYNPASEDQQALPHVQNVRGRYRLRLNFDSDIHPMISFHGQLSTGPLNNHLTMDQDFAAIVARPPIQISEAWVNFRPTKWATFHGGRVREIFSDYNLSYLFDDDLAFNGFNQRLTRKVKSKPAGFRSMEVRSGQYVFTNPNIAIITPGNLGPTGAAIGSTGRSAQLFHQGFLIEQELNQKIFQVLGGDIQIYRNPNQIQFASTTSGFPLLVQNPLGVALSGPIPGTGTATMTPGGAMYTARNFHISRMFYRFEYSGIQSRRQEYPISIQLQLSRNVGTGAAQRDGLLAYARIGKVQKAWDHSLSYLFTIKGANSMVSQLADDNLGTLTGVNVRTHFLRFDLGLSKRIQWQSLLFIQNEISNSGQYPNFFVPVNAYSPRLYRFQEQILFGF